jgi:hypothetical protein
MSKLRGPSPALVIALVALFSSFAGGAVAATAVPLAKRALFANNAGKLQGKTAAQIAAEAAATPGPAATVAANVGTKTAALNIAANTGQDVTVACDAGQKAVGGGFSTTGAVLAVNTAPTNDGAGWRMYLLNVDDASAASGTAYAICLR